ncbi:MAG: aldolase/citrate lyase family protein [Anaerolineales bacterium]|jgi:2-keto-3-deoxy-L-rhamnonate aldolase RhmA
MTINLRKRLKNGELVLGTILSLNSPAAAEILSQSGFDWIFIDAEHSTLDPHHLQAIFQAVGDSTPCVVRIPLLDEIVVKKTLDAGAAGLLAPQIHNAEQAELLVKWGRYYPEGFRGLGFGRAQGYGLKVGEYLETANQNILLSVQAESAQAVRNIENIVQVKGLDAMLVGPYDLSASMGLPGQIDHPDVQAAIQRVADVCKESAMPIGIFGLTAEAVKHYIEQGFRFIVAGVDTVMLGNSARQLLDQLRN